MHTERRAHHPRQADTSEPPILRALRTRAHPPTAPEALHATKPPGAAGFLLGLAPSFVDFQTAGDDGFARGRALRGTASRITALLLGGPICRTLGKD